jgi:hypothetical protein
MLKPIAIATLISGTLDILLATALTLLNGRAPADMLRFVASGPFPAATGMGTAGAILGLVVHFSLMAIMAAVFMWLARARPILLETPIRTALAYGIVTYIVLDLLVVPLRFPGAFPPKPLSIATQLFAHIVLVALVFVFVARRTMKKELQAMPAAA